MAFSFFDTKTFKVLDDNGFISWHLTVDTIDLANGNQKSDLKVHICNETDYENFYEIPKSFKDTWHKLNSSDSLYCVD